MVHADEQPAEPPLPASRNSPGLGQDPAILASMREQFLDFYERERPLVERFLMLAGACRQDAEDGAHEAFAEAWCLVARGLWFQVSNWRAWLRTVAYRSFLRPPGQRRSARAVSMELDDLRDLDVGARSPDHAELAVQSLAVLDALDQLGDRQASAVIALDLDAFTSSEIAAILGIGEQRVRDLRKKARGHLKRILAATALDGKEELRP